MFVCFIDKKNKRKKEELEMEGEREGGRDNKAAVMFFSLIRFEAPPTGALC